MNVIHSIDGMIVREMNRRCNYDPAQLKKVRELVLAELGEKAWLDQPELDATKFLPLGVIEYIDSSSIKDYSDNDLFRLLNLLNRTLEYRSFPIITIHDDFKCSPNHMNKLRENYIEIFCELNESDIISDILTQIRGKTTTIHKAQILSSQFRNSDYALS